MLEIFDKTFGFDEIVVSSSYCVLFSLSNSILSLVSRHFSHILLSARLELYSTLRFDEVFLGDCSASQFQATTIFHSVFIIFLYIFLEILPSAYCYESCFAIW